MNHKLQFLSVILVVTISTCTNSEQRFLGTSPPLIHYRHTENGESTKSSQSDQIEKFDLKASEYVSQMVMGLAYNIGKELGKHSLFGAQIFSPASIASAMSLLLLGSNGKTFQELMQLFGYDQSSYFTKYPFKIHQEFGFLIEDLIADGPNPSRYRPEVAWRSTDKKDSEKSSSNLLEPVSNYHKIHIANGVFVQNGYSLRPDFIKAVQGIYLNEVTQLDFARNPRVARNYINDWINRNTFGKISNIISDQLQSDTKVIMGSALYFKAFWDKKFLASGTIVSDFYPDGLKAPSIKVNMMSNGGIFPFYEGNDCNCKIMGLPYQGNLSTMYIFQPKDSTRQKLSEFQTYLTPEKMEELIDKMKLKTAVLAFPKMHLSNSFNLRKLFSDMGVTTLFSSTSSDLSLIADEKTDGHSTLILKPQKRPLSSVDTTQNNRFSNQHDLHETLIFSDRIFDSNNSKNESTTSNTESLPTTTEYFDTNNEKTPSRRRQKRGITYKVESNLRNQPLRFKDLIVNKRITKLNPDKKILRKRRGADSNSLESLKALDDLRNNQNLIRPSLNVEDVVHKVDLTINEEGTEGGAATVTYLRRSGSDAAMRAETPFLILIRHDKTKIPLFYGPVYEPSDF